MLRPVRCSSCAGMSVHLQRNTQLETISTKQKSYPLPIRSFIAPYWTLEYSIARSQLSKCFWGAVYVCWKSKNRDYVYTEEERRKYISAAENEFDDWKVNETSTDEIAYKIYKETLLDKKLSKAVVAQVFAQILIDQTTFDIKSDENLKYIAEAIYYASNKSQ